MTNIKLTIEYHGLPYCGWQYQKNEKTVQGEIEKAIFKFSGEKKTIQGAGRTDAGVPNSVNTSCLLYTSPSPRDP